MVARAQVAQGIQAVVGAIGAGGAVAKAQVWPADMVQQAGGHGDGAAYGQGKLAHEGLGLVQGSAQLFWRGLELLQVLQAASAGVEAVEHHPVQAQGQGQVQGAGQGGQVEAGGHEDAHHSGPPELEPGHGLGGPVEGAGVTREVIEYGRLIRQQRQLEDADLCGGQAIQRPVREQLSVGDQVDLHLSAAQGVD